MINLLVFLASIVCQQRNITCVIEYTTLCIVHNTSRDVWAVEMPALLYEHVMCGRCGRVVICKHIT